MDVFVDLVNIQVVSSLVTCFQYYEDIIIAAAYPYLFPLGNSVCVILMGAPIQTNLLLLFSIDARVGRHITLLLVLYNSSFIFLSWVVIVVPLTYGLFYS